MIGREAWMVPGVLLPRAAPCPDGAAVLAGQSSAIRAPKVSRPISSARAWPMTVPVTSGCSRAQVRAEAVLVKKLSAPQLTVAAGPGQLRLPRNTTVLRGSQTVVR